MDKFDKSDEKYDAILLETLVHEIGHATGGVKRCVNGVFQCPDKVGLEEAMNDWLTIHMCGGYSEGGYVRGILSIERIVQGLNNMGHAGEEIIVRAHCNMDTQEFENCLDSVMGDGFFSEYNECQQYINRIYSLERAKIERERIEKLRRATSQEEKELIEQQGKDAMKPLVEKLNEYFVKLDALEAKWKSVTGVNENQISDCYYGSRRRIIRN